MAREQERSRWRGRQRRYHFEGRHMRSDEAVRGEIDAPNEKQARRLLQRRSVAVISLMPVPVRRAKRIRRADIAVFTRQFAAMLRAGLPVLQVFAIIAKGHHNASLSRLLERVRADVEQGMSLAQAFARYPKYFNGFFCSVVAAGELGGVLDVLMDELATYYEKTLVLRKKIMGVLAYPLTVLGVSAVLLAVMLGFVLPEFEKVYNEVGAPLPWFTRMLIALGGGVRDWGLPALAVAAALLWLLVRGYRRSVNWQRRVDKMLLAVPVWGGLVRKTVLARWTRTAAILLSAGVPLLEILEAVADVAENAVYADATREIRRQVNQGVSLATAMRSTGVFSDMAVEMTAAGEEAGALDVMLNKTAEFYEGEVDNTVSVLSSLLEPAVMVVLGALIGAVLIAMYLPLFNLGSVVR